jgi:DNA-binding response OmpR family regulator
MNKKTVLLVEDDELIRKSLKLILEKEHGYDVIDFPDGPTAIKTISEKEPQIDAAILDIVMHGHGGTVREHLRANPKYEQTFIIYYSGLDENQLDNEILVGAYFVNKDKGSVKQVCKLLKELLD